MKTTSESPAEIKESAQESNIDKILKRLDEFEARCDQLENAIKDTVTFESLATRLTGSDNKSKARKRTRAKREWSEEEKAVFHERMVAARLAKQKVRQKAANIESTKK